MYDRPRLAPKINLPVPKNAAHKFSYKPIGSPPPTTPSPPNNEKDGDEEVQIPVETQKIGPVSTPVKSATEISADTSSRSYKKTKLDTPPVDTPRMNFRRRPIFVTETAKQETSSIRLEEPSSTSAPPEEPTTAKARTIMRKFRRPFLPSRGGNPYTARNLKPVGEKATVATAPNAEGENLSDPITGPGTDDYEEEEIQERRPDKPKPVRVKSPLLVDISAELRKSSELKDNSNVAPTKVKLPPKLKLATERPDNEANIEAEDKSTESSIEKLYENYDETLNEASPIINFPYQKYTTAVGNPNNYIYNNRFYRSTKLSTN